MPVADHPVHESTKRADSRPACYDKREPFAEGFFAQDGWETRRVFIPLPHGGFDVDLQQPKLVWVPHKMTTKCQSDLDLCAGCKDFKGENNG